MNNQWFKKSAWVYLPVSWQGFAVSLFALGLCTWFFIAIDRNSHSVSDTLINFFIYFSAIIFWWKWVAEKTSE